MIREVKIYPSVGGNRAEELINGALKKYQPEGCSINYELIPIDSYFIINHHLQLFTLIIEIIEPIELEEFEEMEEGE